MDGNIVADGTDGANFVLVRYLANGTLDISFNSLELNGVVVTTIGSSADSSIEWCSDTG